MIVMNWKQRISRISFYLIPFVFLLGIAVSIFIFRDQKTKSDLFLQKVPQKPWHELIPALKQARVFVVDRPHDPEELKHPDDLSQSKRIRSFYISTNEMGLRHPPIGSKEKFRILCVGESVTFGWGVDVKDSYPAQLSRILGVDAINAGIPSARIEQSKVWIQKHAKALDADLILLTYRPDWNQANAINNFVAAIKDIQKIVHPIPLGLILSPISSFDIKGLQYAQKEEQELPAKLGSIALLNLSPIFREQKTEFGVRLIVKENQQKLINVNDGMTIVDVSTNASLQRHNRLAPQILLAFEENANIHEPFIFDGGHPDEQGYLLMAEQVAQWILRNRWYRSEK